MRSERKNEEGLRVIKTARTLEAINKSLEEGFWPLVKPVNTSPPYGGNCFAVYQSTKTGEVWELRDSIELFDLLSNEAEEVIPWQKYYLPRFKLPYAAYLVPKDLATGTRVWLEDLIEDFAGSRRFQLDRLDSAAAIWNGKDFEVDYDPNRDSPLWMG